MKIKELIELLQKADTDTKLWAESMDERFDIVGVETVTELKHGEKFTRIVLC